MTLKTLGMGIAKLVTKKAKEIKPELKHTALEKIMG